MADCKLSESQLDLLESLSRAISFRVALVGDAKVGKSRLFYKFASLSFCDAINTGIAAQLTHSTVIRKESVTFNVWDTAGQIQFRKFLPYYCKNSDAVIIVYDITSRKSFDIAKSLLFDVLKKCSGEMSIALVGNKLDLEKLREVPTSEAEILCQKTRILFFETSAKTDLSVNRIFHALYLENIFTDQESQGCLRRFKQLFKFKKQPEVNW